MSRAKRQIVDEAGGITYSRGELLGKGGFASAYACTGSEGSEVAIKVVLKRRLSAALYTQLGEEIATHEVQHTQAALLYM